ncbi:MAG: glutaminyl-peptide cyclotransferase, partial [Sphingomonadales bacterium]
MKRTCGFTLLLTGLAVSGCNNNDQKNSTATTFPAVATPGLDVVAAYAHDTSSYTQGLVVYKGQLYEGTGQYGASALLKTDLMSGKALQRLP